MFRGLAIIALIGLGAFATASLAKAEDYTIKITDAAKIEGVAKATEAYNATLDKDAKPLTPQQYLQMNAENWADSYAKQYGTAEPANVEEAKTIITAKDRQIDSLKAQLSAKESSEQN